MITPSISAFGNYAKGLSVPSTDNLYASFFFPKGTDQAKPKPEETDSFDLGARFRSSKVQAQVGVWKTRFKNRSAVSFDPEANTTVFRNLGTVDKWGIDGSVAYSPIRALTLYAFAAWNKSEIKDNIQIGSIPVTAFNPAGTTCDTIAAGTLVTDAQAARSCAFTAGKREGGSPTYNWGFSALGTVGPIDLGITAKKTGSTQLIVWDDANQSQVADISVSMDLESLNSELSATAQQRIVVPIAARGPASAQVVYVGKAASLRSRVRSYFQEARPHDPKTDALVGQIRDLEYIVTDNELEALMLEANLVRKHRPRYNIILRDDKHYPFLKLTTDEGTWLDVDVGNDGKAHKRNHCSEILRK